MYQHPGVYIEELPSGSAPIEAASTSTALIVGYAVKGPVGVPTLLFNFDQYAAQFGGIRDFSQATNPLPDVDRMGHSVQAFFNNGGTKAYIARLALDGTTTATALLASAGNLVVPAGGNTPSQVVPIHAANAGTWGDGLVVNAVATGGSPPLYTVSVGRLDRQGNFKASETYTDVSFVPGTDNFIVTQINGVSRLIECEDRKPSVVADLASAQIGSVTSVDLSGFDLSGLASTGFDVVLDGPSTAPVAFTGTPPTDLAGLAAEIQAQVRSAGPNTLPYSDFTCTVENNCLVLRSGTRGGTSSAAVGHASSGDSLAVSGFSFPTTISAGAALVAAYNTSSTVTLGGGGDGLLPGSAEYGGLLPVLKKIRDISIIFLPGQVWPDNQDIISIFVGHAETMKNRMVIVDPRQNQELITTSDVAGQTYPNSTYTALYYPWLEVINPWYHAELRPNRPRTVMVPPSGFAAGLWAKTDGRRGVWKAPAGLQSSLLGAASTHYKVGDDEQDQLNPAGVNCYRRIISDIVIWGSRTLATKTDPEWRYVPVRRTAMMIEESVYQGIQWAVFEPNDHRLWSALRLNIGVFMDSLFRAGAFQGEKASDAYFVRCGLGDTMTQGDIDAGQVIVMVGFAPVKPAEFVIVRIQQIVGKQ